MKRRRSTGFTLIELMIVVAMIGILAGIGLPLYAGYIQRVDMAKINLHYEQAVRVARTKSAITGAIGMQPAPTTSQGWVDVFDEAGAVAPGGGPAYVVGLTGAPTGAVGVSADDPNYDVAIVRPAYLELEPYRAEVIDGNVAYVPL